MNSVDLSLKEFLLTINNEKNSGLKHKVLKRDVEAPVNDQDDFFKEEEKSDSLRIANGSK